jgi:hypothetical protein
MSFEFVCVFLFALRAAGGLGGSVKLDSSVKKWSFADV